MLQFQCDYTEGAHPKILERMMETNLEQTVGYGLDPYCESARAKIRTACGKPDADVHFLVGGTQANRTVIASILRPYQGAVAAEEGHINCHETGAVEATGHKVLALPCKDGMISAAQVREYLQADRDNEIREHTVQPGLVYVSFPTESGTLYTKQELTDLYAVCRAFGVPLFIDGARLGYGLMSPACDLTLRELADRCDVFYIGGTKCGALFGEAVVIPNESLRQDFRYMIKREGGMLAKGRLLGLQFDTLFTDDLYFRICKQAVDHALSIRRAFEAKGVEMHGTSMTNQQFPVLTEKQLAYFGKKYLYEYWCKAEDGERSIVRFCTSWATSDQAMEGLLADIRAM